MGLFDKFKKKNEPQLNWQEEPLIAGATVEYYVKKVLKNNPKATGAFYINDTSYDFSYGNLSDIINPNIMSQTAYRLCVAYDDNRLYYRIEC